MDTFQAIVSKDLISNIYKNGQNWNPMKNTKMTEEFITTLKVYAAKKTIDWDFGNDVYSCCSGNIDDAYDLGVREGMTFMARDILDELKLEYK